MRAHQLIVPLVLAAVATPVWAWSTTPPGSGTSYVHLRVFNRIGGVCNGLEDNSLNRYYESGEAITFSLAECTQRIMIIPMSNGGGEPDIGRIRLSDGTSASVGDVEIVFSAIEGNWAVPSGDEEPLRVGNDWAGLDTTFVTPPIVFYGGINGNLTGNVDVKKLLRLDVGGAINAPIIIGSPGFFGSTCVIEAGASSSAGSITLAIGNIKRVRFFQSGGVAAGSITASNGDITLVMAEPNVARLSGSFAAPLGKIGFINGNNGSVPLGPASGTHSTITANYVNRIVAGSTRADITASAAATSASQALQEFQITGPYEGKLSVRRVEVPSGSGWTDAVSISGATTGIVTVDGDILSPVRFNGGLTAGTSGMPSVPNMLSVSGAVQSTLTVTGNLAVPATIGAIGANGGLSITGDLPFGKTLNISGNLAGTITLPANGLKGQVIVNAANSGGTWTGTVNVGSIQLKPNNIVSPDDSAPYYWRVSSNLGGGAVGLAPINLYGPDCAPENDPDGTGVGIFENALHAPGGHVEARFYGPIQKKNAAAWSTHVMVQCRPLPPNPDCNYPWTVDPCSWIDVSSAFDVAGPEASTTDQLARRTITLSPRAGYHVRPGIYMAYPVESDSVRSADVAGNPAAVWPAACDENLGTDRPGYVFVVSGDCNADGIADQRQCPHAQGCGVGCAHADFNYSGSITVEDVFDFLAAYFSADPTADVNNSGTITTQDIFDFLAEYFGCQG